MKADFTTAEALGVKDISPAIVGYFNYYARKYPAEILGSTEIITISVWDGCRSLDSYFIDVLTRNGWSYTYYALLKQIYLIRKLEA